MNIPFRYQLAILFSWALIASCATGVQLRKTEVSVIEISPKNSMVSAEIATMIEPYKAQLDAELNEVLIISTDTLVKARPEGKLGNFVADLVFEIANRNYTPSDSLPVDICVLNNGGLRTSLPMGNITKRKIFELMPFENEIVVLTLSPEKVDEMLTYIAKAGGVPVSNMSMTIVNDSIYENVTINNVSLDKNRNYKVATSDYLAHGGDQMHFFKNPLNYETINYKIRDAIIDFLKDEKSKGNQLTPVLDGRIKYHEQ